MTMFAVAKTKAEGSPLYLLKSRQNIRAVLRFNGNLFISKICLQGSLENVALSCPQFKELERIGEVSSSTRTCHQLMSNIKLYYQLSSRLQNPKGVA